MKYAQIRNMDISDGEGVRASLFVQGCPHHCKNCFNEDTWDFDGGKEWNKKIEDEFIEICNRSYVDGVSILGGEPFAQDEDLINLIKRIYNEVKKPLWIWTGYTYETIPEKMKECIPYCQVIVDGKFIEELKDLKLEWKGSSNQRVIDVQKTLKENKIVIWRSNE